MTSDEQTVVLLVGAVVLFGAWLLDMAALWAELQRRRWER